MRTRYSVLNMAVSFIGQFINLLLLFLSRRIFVRYFAVEYLGVNGLFSNIISVLSLAELGIGTAMIYNLYKPAAENDRESLCRLVNLYRLLYRIVGGVVLTAGMVLIPFLPYLIRDSGEVRHITGIYLMYLFDTVCSYMLAYKQSVLTANQQTFLITGVSQAVRAGQIILQIILIVVFRNFYLYLAIQMCTNLVTNLILSYIVDRKYPYVRKNREGLPQPEIRKKICRHIASMASHKFGAVLVAHTDNLIIYAFVGLATVGIYSNYQMVLNSIKQLMSYIYGSFSAGIGNMAASSDSGRLLEIYKSLNLLMSMIYGYIAVCLFFLFNPFIGLFFGEEYTLPVFVTGLIVFDFYLHGMRQMTLRFRDSMGLYWYDRYKPVAEILLNLSISIVLVKRYQIAGVIAGTVISSLLTNFWIEPLVFMKYGIGGCWKRNLMDYFRRYGVSAAIVSGDIFFLWFLFRPIPAFTFLGIVVRGFLCTAIYGGTVFMVYHCTPEWKILEERGRSQISSTLKRRGEAHHE